MSEMKKYEIWIGFRLPWGQGEDSPTEPKKIGEVEATSFRIACCIHAHQSKIDDMKRRMKEGDKYIEDGWFGTWQYQPRDNSDSYLRKFYETEEDAWETFKNK